MKKELCFKFVIYKDYTEMHGQQNIKINILFAKDFTEQCEIFLSYGIQCCYFGKCVPTLQMTLLSPLSGFTQL